MDLKYLTQALSEHKLLYSEQERAAEVIKDLAIQCAMNGVAVDRLTAEVERLRAVIRDDVDCPHPANGAPDGISAGECMKRLECGCVYGLALNASQQSTMEK